MATLRISRSRLDANIARVQSIADRHGLSLRPHVKTHKCLEIARLQLAAGADGLTASRPREAAVFLEEGLGPVTIAYPIVSLADLEEPLAAARRHGLGLRLIVDSVEGIRVAAAASKTFPLEVVVKIDVGLHRCGVRPDDPAAVGLASMCADVPSLNFVGILSHAGHAYGASSLAEVSRIAEDERQQMLDARRNIESAGIPCPVVSVGSTPTVLAAASFDGITEIRPGNSVFLDRTQVALGVASLDDLALTVEATVISRNDRFLIIDAGSKTLSSDRGAQGMASLDGFGLVLAEDGDTQLQLERLSEEHGFVGRRDSDLPIGARVAVLPNHACVVSNLAPGFHIDDEFWSVRR